MNSYHITFHETEAHVVTIPADSPEEAEEAFEAEYRANGLVHYEVFDAGVVDHTIQTIVYGTP